MFVRFRQTASRLQLSLVESRREGGKVRCEHIAALGSIPCPMTKADRVAFWRLLFPRLEKLGNRIADEKLKILDAIHARIPIVTPDEQTALQRENAEADVKLWETLQDMNASKAEGLKGVAALTSGQAAEAEAEAAKAAAEAARAKERLDKLAKGEAVAGGLGKPATREDMLKILKAAGMTLADIRHSRRLAALGKEHFELFLQETLKELRRAEKRIDRKVLRKLGA